MPARPENALNMARRHVREGDERLARQAIIVGKMEAEGHDEQAALARRLLPGGIRARGRWQATLRRFLQRGISHMGVEERARHRLVG
jgi:hypothetical protein